MQIESVWVDSARLDVGSGELGLLSDVLGVFLGYEDAWDRSEIDRRRPVLDALHTSVIETLARIGVEDRRRSGPFETAERVVRIAPDSSDREARELGTVISRHAPDRAHDYDWCVVQFDDGNAREVPMFELRRFKVRDGDDSA